MKGKTMNSTSRIIVLYFAMASVFTLLTGLGIGSWLAVTTGSADQGTQLIPSGFIFLFGFGMVVMGWLATAERSHASSTKWYYHGPVPVRVQ